MRSNLIHLLFVSTALTAAATDADAKPRRVVVLEFDGPHQLADVGRAAVMNVLGEQYNIVATKTWDAARARASGRGPQQWRQASKQAGVDAVIEGWVQQEGRHHVLTIAVKVAATGQEIDTLSVRLKDKLVPTDAAYKLAGDLDDVLSWIDGDVTAEPSSSLPDVRTLRPMLGARDPERDRKEREDAVRDDDDDRGRDDEGRRRDDNDDGEARERRARDDDRGDHVDDDDGDNARPHKKRRKVRAELDSKRVVAAIDDEQKDTNDLVTLFGPESKETEIVTEGKSTHVPRPTPRFLVGAGPYLAARGMTFDYDAPDEKSPRPPEYPASFIKGFAAHAAVFPLPHQKQDGKLSGVGFSLDVAKSVASVLTIQNNANGEFRDCTIDQTTWNVGVHYRWPIDFVAIGVTGNYGKSGHAIVDAPEDLGFADTDFSYVGGGASVELSVTERATVGFNARYMYLLAAGNITEEAAYGAGTAYGLGLGGEFVVPLPSNLYLRGAVDYARFVIDFEGSGELTQQFGVFNVVDSAITGSANVGVAF